ncbi:MAG: cytochrome c-type biogenesis protein [Gammaproteobacteria bacterium]
MNRITAALALCLMLCCGPLQATATLESFKFDSTEQEQHFKELIEELRCLVCQNQSLADSDAELAHDLRAEVYDMLQDGKDDAQIVEFLVARYGDFVLYSPPMKPSTWLIWFGPFVLLLVAAMLLLRSLRSQQQAPQQELSDTDRTRLEQVLHDSESGKGPQS